MSTNKTEHYGLHSWVAEDDFLRSEINENFEKLDQLLVRGSYVGDGSDAMAVELGFRPRFLFVMGDNGHSFLGAPESVGCIRGVGINQGVGSTFAADMLQWGETGFTVVKYTYSLNSSGKTYRYCALR